MIGAALIVASVIAEMPLLGNHWLLAGLAGVGILLESWELGDLRHRCTLAGPCLLRLCRLCEVEQRILRSKRQLCDLLRQRRPDKLGFATIASGIRFGASGDLVDSPCGTLNCSSACIQTHEIYRHPGRIGISCPDLSRISTNTSLTSRQFYLHCLYFSCRAAQADRIATIIDSIPALVSRSTSALWTLAASALVVVATFPESGLAFLAPGRCLRIVDSFCRGVGGVVV